MQLAKDFVRAHPEKALVIAADIARYDLEIRVKPRKDAVRKLIISAQPRMLSLDDASGYYTEDVMDFGGPIIDPKPW